MEMPFSQIPTGSEIAHYFVSECSTGNQGSEGFDLYRDGSDYCYIWEVSRIDLDLRMMWLLDVRTGVGATETRDFLSVAVRDFGPLFSQWMNKPYTFGKGDYGLHVSNGLRWFLERTGPLFD